MNMISNVDNDLNKFSEIVWIEKNSILPRKFTFSANRRWQFQYTKIN